MEFRDLVARRRMVRRFEQEPLPREVVKRSWGEADVLRALGVPDGCRPIGVIGLGHPLADEKFDPSAFTRRRRSLDSMLHFGRWQAE